MYLSVQNQIVMIYLENIINSVLISAVYTLLPAPNLILALTQDARSLSILINIYVPICECTMASKMYALSTISDFRRISIDKRYTCVNEACLPTAEHPIVFYPTWTALQHHTRMAHPPTCTDPSCNGRVFASQKGLRLHQRIHEQRDEETQLNAVVFESDRDDEQPPKKRRRGGEHGRDWKCEVEGCEKDFKSVRIHALPEKLLNFFLLQSKALNVHHKVTHLGRKDFICSHESCGASFGYKHLLQRHVVRLHFKHSDNSSTDKRDAYQDASSSSGSDVPTKPLMGIEDITGSAYTSRAQELLGTTQAIRCPYPHLQDISFVLCSRDDETATEQLGRTESTLAGPYCAYVFRRAYDLRRHLRAIHKVEAVKESTDLWVSKMKLKEIGA